MKIGCRMVLGLALALLFLSPHFMRRANAASVKVKAPSRGLVSRWPGEVADLFRGDDQRVVTVARNMRFEDGVMANGPGYERVRPSSDLLASVLAHWSMDETQETRFDSVGDNDLLSQKFYLVSGEDTFQLPSVAGKFGNAAWLGLSSSFPTLLYCPSAACVALGSNSFSVCGWFNPRQITQPAAWVWFPGFRLYQNGSTLSFQTWNGSSWAVSLNAAAPLVANTWYFAAIQYNSGTGSITLRLNAASSSRAGGTVVLGHQGFSFDGFAVSDGDPTHQNSFYADSITVWTRVLSGSELDYVYNSGTGRDYPFFGVKGHPNLIHEGNLVSSPNRPLLLGTDTDLLSVGRGFSADPRFFEATFASLFSGTSGTNGYFWSGTDFYDKIIFAQHDNVPQYWINGNAATFDLPGLTVNQDQYSAVSDGSEKFDGVTTFFGHVLLWKNDIVKWSDLNDFTNFIPVLATASSATLTIAADFTQPAVGSTVTVTTTEDPSGSGTSITVGQFVSIADSQTSQPYYNFYSVTAKTTGPNTVTLKLLGTTRRTASAATILTGKFIETLDANEAGQAQIVGSLVNGPIFQIVPMGDYAYIFKEWSIQSMQYVGAGSGVFFSRTEVTREGPVGRNAVRNLGNGSIVFLGHRELYSYSGGSQPTPVCRQYTRQLFAELDRTRLDEILIHHREPRNEVWVIYPVTGGQKVLIWNYVEDTASIDEYDDRFDGISALTAVNWTVDPSWSSEPSSLSWGIVNQLLSWSDLTDSGNIESTLIAMGDGTLLIHGFVYDRDGVAYTSLTETMDHDFGDNTLFKYIDAVHVGLQVNVTDNAPRNLYIQVGTRTTLDADIQWTDATAINVQGNANFTAKVNPGGSGRYVRLRFFSTDADIQWRVSSYEIYARTGGTY